ncbi:hypothetical protein OG539_27615 [Actinacidiphila glaucinigra]|uniref:hypothetical protein n=1 Tax=Actinacidiphila glaucinigra TaxID=235986 RepID=UPI002DD89A4C|nr:hypothetical protein [Actinacidiphila glaucinigra]WSD60193.1 hypothetical protein OIE69_15290 [Actinacidiphila glaucinigra]
MDRMKATGRHYGLIGLVAAAAVVVAVGLGVPMGAIFILAVALICPLMMLVMLHALRGPEAHRHPVVHPVVEAIDSTGGRGRRPSSGARPPTP